MVIETARLVLRPYVAADAAAVTDIFADAGTCRYLLNDAWSAADAAENVKKKLNANALEPGGSLCLACTHAGTVIGDVSVWYTEMRETVEIGYVFHRAHTGRGFATEAVAAVIAYLFETVNVHRIQANLDARNTASARLLERVGMRREAAFIQDYWSKGEWTDSFVYGMLLDDYKTHRAAAEE